MHILIELRINTPQQGPLELLITLRLEQTFVLLNQVLDSYQDPIASTVRWKREKITRPDELLRCFDDRNCLPPSDPSLLQASRRRPKLLL